MPVGRDQLPHIELTRLIARRFNERYQLRRTRSSVSPTHLLSKQSGREEEAEAAYREAIDSGATDQVVEAAAGKLGELLARQGDVAGAHAAFEVAARAVARRMGCDFADSTIAKLARFRTAVARRPWALRLNRSIRAVICRLGPVLRSRWQRTRRRPN